MLIIGNPENRRVTLFQQALRDLHQPPASIISWLDLLQNPANLHSLSRFSSIRIESPGENFQVEKGILELGGLESAKQLIEEKGRIYFPGIWYKGFKKILSDIASAAPRSIWFNRPDDIALMFDKPKVKALNPDHSLAALPSFNNYENFFAYACQQNYPRFFIKLNYSSSASGVLAFEYHRKTGKVQAQTTMELVRHDSRCYFYNSLKVKKYSHHQDLQDLIDFLFQQGAYVEPWITKAQHDDGVFDLRVLAINGTRQHSIARVSNTPITNLHLGNQRCAINDLNLSSSRNQQIEKLVSDVMQTFPRSLYSGLDILLPRDENKLPILLEVNAFGDLLPDLLHQGKNTYQAELIALYEQYPQLMKKVA